MFASFPYRHAPVWVQELLIWGRSSLRTRLRESSAFEAAVADVDASQWWPEHELREFQRARLHAVVERAAREVPYYRDRYRQLDLDPGALEFPKDIAKLPLISKPEVRAAGRSLMSERKRGPLFSGSTSGTSGSPLSLLQDLSAINRENAFIWRQLAWAGLRRGERRAWIRGDMIVPGNQQGLPYWRLDRADNMLMLSSFHLSEASALAYLEALARFDPVLIQAYPSSIGFLAAWMLGTGRTYGGQSLRAVVASSETLSEARRAEIERAFGCRVFDHYGQFERVAAIATCERGRYHLLTDYSFVELLPADDGLFELVGTGFNNLAMPLVRYRCGDLVRPAPASERCACGRAFPLIEGIIGRMDDVVKTSDGRSVGRLHHIFNGVEGILEAQIRQDRLDAVTILVVPAAGYDGRTENMLLARTRARLGERMAIEIRPVESIPRTRNGKFQLAVCNINRAG
jgi:phenylacetate-CoA ligase